MFTVHTVVMLVECFASRLCFHRSSAQLIVFVIVIPDGRKNCDASDQHPMSGYFVRNGH